MTYQTLLVNLDIGASNEALLKVAAGLAQQFDADVIGIGAFPLPEVNYYGEAYVMSDFIAQDRSDLGNQSKLTEERFRASLHNRARSVEWRSSVVYDFASDYVARQARAADLILTNGGKPAKGTHRPSVGNLVMQVGRPVLVVGGEEVNYDLQNAIIAWKDTREAQRAVASALPLLKKATQITLVEIAAAAELAGAEERVQDVAKWLRRHGVAAETLVLASDGDDAAHLGRLAREKQAGLLVGGAYGHSRLREWVLGGVTRDLLLHSDHCSLISH